MPKIDVPQSVETERAVLGAVLLDNAAFPQLAELDASEFFLDSHRVIFSAMREMAAAVIPVDLVTLAQRLIDSGQLDRIGGGSYISSLTDGLPKLDNISHYAKIVKEKAAARRMMQAGISLAEAAQSGVPAEELADTVRALVPGPESSNGSQPSKSLAEKVYPTVPDAAWCDTAKVYYDALRNSTSASEAYHLAIFIAAAGMILGRSCFFRLPKPKFANFYVALVGRAGKAKKGTAMDYGIDLVTDCAPDVPWLSSVDSAEGFVEFLSHNQRQRETKDSPGLLYFSELRSLVDKASKEGSRNIIPKLAEAFDCGQKIEVGTRHNPLIAKHPIVTIFGGASPTWLDKLTMADLEGGLGSRFVWIPCNAKEPFPDPPPIDRQRWNSVVHTLGEARRYWGERKQTEFKFTPAAGAMWGPVFKKLYRSTTGDPLIEIMGERADLHCRKVAMVYAAIERGEPLIDVQHLSKAVAYTDFLVESLYAIFSDFGLSEKLKEQRLIRKTIHQYMPSGLTRKKLRKRLWRIETETFNRQLRWMIEEGEIQAIISGNPPYQSQFLFLPDWEAGKSLEEVENGP